MFLKHAAAVGRLCPKLRSGETDDDEAGFRPDKERLYFIDSLVGMAWEALKPVFNAVSFQFHFQNIARGVLDTRDLFFFVAIIVLALLLSRFTLESRKWKA